MKQFRSLVLIVFAALVVHSALPVPGAEQGGADRAVEAGLRAALLGKPEEVRKVARLRLLEEKKLRSEGNAGASISENIEALAIVSQRPVPLLAEKRRRLGEYREDQLTRNLDRLMRRVPVSQRFLEARKDARYEGLRRIFNGIVVPLSGIPRGQLFGLLSLPFDGMDEVFVGSRFVTPVQRRELYLARDAARDRDALRGTVQQVVGRYTARRRDLAALQAEQNADRAREDGRTFTALFWYQKEMELRQWRSPRDGGHRRLLSEQSRVEAGRARGITITDGDALFFSASEFAGYARVARLFLLPGRRAEFAGAVQDFRINFPTSSALDDVNAADAARSMGDGETVLARVQLEEIAAAAPPTPWAMRSALMLERKEFSPSRSLREAEGKVAGRFWSFLLKGEDPEVLDRSLTAEEARIRRGGWIQKARALFITDTIARALFLPFLDAFPEPELVDAGARVDPKYFDSAEGRRWLRRVMRAQEIEKQYEDARGSAVRLGLADKQLSLQRKAARRLEKLGDEAPRARESAAIFARLLNAYPSYANRGRVEKKLAEARLKSRSVVEITPDELRAYPVLWKEQGLRLSSLLLDGDRANGEVARDGVAILDYDAYSYTDRESGRRVEVPMAREDRQQVLRSLEPRRRLAAVSAELKKPLPRRRIPVALDAGVFPGFDVSPSLIPLEVDSRERELYE